MCFRVVCPCVRASVRDLRGSFMFLRYLQYLLTDFCQTFVTGASRDRDDLNTFLGQKVKVQGHAIAAEALPSSATFSSFVIIITIIVAIIIIIIAVVTIIDRISGCSMNWSWKNPVHRSGQNSLSHRIT